MSLWIRMPMVGGSPALSRSGRGGGGDAGRGGRRRWVSDQFGARSTGHIGPDEKSVPQFLYEVRHPGREAIRQRM